ncbi:MAG: type II secretion system F family protein [Candidatus Omnitrophica bacterium]|nr:type II secretion system F family protein [Candidatus Omnitrophota bacterium]
MPFRIIFLEEFGKAFVPKRAIPHLRLFLLKAGIPNVPYKFFGALFYLTAAITAIIYLLFAYPFLLQYSQLVLLAASAIAWFIIQISLATLFILLVYFYVDLRIYKRTKKMEETLPDFLQVVASNLKGGLSFEKALLGAIKPRFTILANEMAEVSKKVMTGHDVSAALYELGQKYDSLMLRRSIDLMIGELESGGQIANLIDKIVLNIKEIKVLKEEISASAVSYMIFMAAIVIFIAPLLFALSYNLLTVILGFISKLSVATTSGGALPFSITEVSIEPDNFRYFSIAALAVISFFSSLIVSIVEKGSIKSGLKYIPIFLMGSLIMYFIFMKILSLVFSGIMF